MVWSPREELVIMLATDENADLSLHSVSHLKLKHTARFLVGVLHVSFSRHFVKLLLENSSPTANHRLMLEDLGAPVP